MCMHRCIEIFQDVLHTLAYMQMFQEIQKQRQRHRQTDTDTDNRLHEIHVQKIGYDVSCETNRPRQTDLYIRTTRQTSGRQYKDILKNYVSVTHLKQSWILM